MALFSALLGSVAPAIVGGLFNRKAQKDANVANSPASQVAGWKAAGVNPLVGITQGQWIPQRPVTAIGDAIIDGGNLLSQELDRQNSLVIEKTRQQGINRRLEKELKAAKANRIPTNMQRYGGALPQGAATNGLHSSGSKVVSDSGSLSDGPNGPNGDRGATSFIGDPLVHNKREGPAFRAFGLDFEGTGAFSTGETFEDAVGEGPLSWVHSALVLGDAVANKVSDKAAEVISPLVYPRGYKYDKRPQSRQSYQYPPPSAPIPQHMSGYAGSGGYSRSKVTRPLH